MVVQARVQAPMAAVKCAWPVQSRPAKGAFQAMALNGRVHDATNAKSRRRIAASAVETVTMTAELPTSSVKTTAASFPPPLPKLDGAHPYNHIYSCISFNLPTALSIFLLLPFTTLCLQILTSALPPWLPLQIGSSLATCCWAGTLL